MTAEPDTVEGPAPGWFYRQAAAVPVRLRPDGTLEVLLITSRRGRWIFPKGVIDPGRTAEQAAVNETWEEAGVRGRLLEPAVGSYEYRKWNGICTVTVFALRVEQEFDRWPEGDRRERRWVDPPRAEKAVRRARLRTMIRLACERVDLDRRGGPGNEGAT